MLKESIEVIRRDYNLVSIITDRDFLPIVGLMDVHAGHKNHREKEFDLVIKYIKENNALWFGLGDWMENANKTSVGAGWCEQVMAPKEQQEYLIKKLKPIAPLCIGTTIGNHEFRTYKDTGFDPMQIMCDRLNIQYLGTELFCIIAKRGDHHSQAWSIYGSHSATTNKTGGLAMNAVQRDWSFVNADIKYKGHGHDRKIDDEQYIDISKKNKGVTLKTRYVVLGGNYLGREDSYISKKPAGPKPTGTIALKLDMKTEYRKVIPIYLPEYGG